MLRAPPIHAFTVAFETVAASRPFVTLVDRTVWVRFRPATRVPTGSTLRLTLDIAELGRPLDLVAESYRETVVGMDVRIVQAPLADLIVLEHILQPDDGEDLAAARALVDAASKEAEAVPPPLQTAPAEGGLSDLLVHDRASIVSDRIVGIDLGTCNSCVCLVEHGAPRVFADDDGDNIPSVVSYLPDGTTLIGRKAVDAMEANPERTIFGAKRFIGRPFNSQPVQNILHKFPYKIVPDSEWGTAIQIGNEARSLITISSQILGYLKGMAERHVGQEIVRAVVTVPAYYNENQRHAVKRAGALAGLQVERIVDEPTAAAIAFGIDKLEKQEQTILVYDLGGGTFDVSILKIKGHTFECIATAGDSFLGGEDFDNRVVDHVIQAYEEGYNQKVWSTHPGVRVRLKRAAEQAKILLSDAAVARIDLDNVPLTTRGTCRVVVNLTRERLEQLVDRYVERTLTLCDSALREAKLITKDLTAVVLVGGQTRMPHVRNRLTKKFGALVRTDVDPARAVAIGAGRLAESLEQGRNDVELQSVLPISIGMSSPTNPVLTTVIPRNTPLPFRQAFQVTVPFGQWGVFTHDIFQGESTDLAENEYLGTLSIYNLAPGTKDPAQLTIEFMLTKECLLHIFVANAATGTRDEVLLITKEVAPSVVALQLRSTAPPAP